MIRLFKNNILILLLSFSNIILAQESTSSPYSRFGLGDLTTQFSSVFTSLGGGGYAMYNDKIINPYSPATYTAFKPNSFLFSTGINHNMIDINSLTESQFVNNTSLSHIVFACPLNERIGASAGLIPFSSIGYTLESRNDDYNADMYYHGDGGISKVYLGGAFKIHNNISVGVNASYLFGGLNRRKKLEFDDETIFNSRSNSLINLKGIYYEFSALYSKDLKSSNSSITLAANASNNTEISAKRSNLVETFEYSGIYEIVKDTFVNTIERGDMILPKYTSLGLTYSKDKWLFVCDYSIQNWSDYELFGETDSLKNSTRVSSGLQYTPDPNSVTQFYKKCHYRLGASFFTTPLQINNMQLEDKSISFGIGIPMRKNKSTYDFSVVIGQRGTNSNNLLRERYIKFGLSMSFEGIWFIKQKYN